MHRITINYDDGREDSVFEAEGFYLVFKTGDDTATAVAHDVSLGEVAAMITSDKKVGRIAVRLCAMGELAGVFAAEEDVEEDPE